MTREDKPIEITRKGTYPIFKYTMRKPGLWRTCVLMDDSYGDIMITTDWGNYAHYWGPSGRGTDSLRAFLVRASIGYIQDKFSYGLSRFNSNLLEQRFKEEVAKAVGNGKIAKDEAETLKEEFIHKVDEFNTSSDYYQAVHGELDDDTRDLLIRIFGDLHEGLPSGEAYVNPGVEAFVARQWSFLVEHWKKELESEKVESPTTA